MVGLESSRSDNPLRKPWRLLIALLFLEQAFEGRRCDKTHPHDVIQGSETAKSAFYPQDMVDLVHTAAADLCGSLSAAARRGSVEKKSKTEDPEAEVDQQVQEEMKKSGLQLVSGKEVSEAMGNECVEWIEAASRELEAMDEFGVFTPIKPGMSQYPSPSEIMPAKLVYGIKTDAARGERTKKVRLVACGNFTSKYSGEVRTHAVDASTVRFILARSEEKGWTLTTVDIATAFLRASFLDDDHQYFIRVPTMLVRLNLVQNDVVLKLRRPSVRFERKPATLS